MQFFQSSMQHAQDGDLGQGPILVRVPAQRRLEGGQGHLVEAEGPHQGVLLDLLDESLLAGNEAGLRTAQELVAAEEDQVGTLGQALPCQRLAGEAETGKVDRRRRCQRRRDRQAVLFAQGR